MRFYRLLFALCLLPLSGYSQISPSLEAALEADTTTWLPIRLQFSSAIDWMELVDEWNAKGIAVEDRPRLVNRLLMKQAQESQLAALSFIQSHELAIEDVRSYYLINAILLKAQASAIQTLALNSTADWIDLADERFIPHEYIESTTNEKSQGQMSTENGLKAINAQALWNLGYTGRGTKVFVYDSGVWSTHPAFADRFLGHYLPIDQAWSGAFSDQPSGINSDHGTHVLGTVAGLDPRTQDTIGVAFGSYWMANDLINASTAANLPGISHLVDAFQWALNPDGDTATSDDVPDVINNSWRWRDEPDTVHCGGYIVQLMNAIEAAGVANVFSGGNTGPSNAVLNSPQRIKTNAVNVFSVGSVNGNIAFPPPISAFSTRGPTQCPTSGNLDIHPEVVAPGENVRSAWGQDGFNTISGTSMSSPHVSGALLLLKEAFPQLSGADLMNALYQTAIDLGVSGEDNTYGNGLIDLGAAYQWLAQQHTPRDPLATNWDISVESVKGLGLNEFGCDSLFPIQVSLKNGGSEPISQFELDVLVNGVSQTGWQSLSSAALQTAGAVDTLPLTFAVNAIGYGPQEITVRVRLDSSEYDMVNNARMYRYHRLPREDIQGVVFREDFEQGFSNKGWYRLNPDLGIGWDTIQTGIPGFDYSARVDLGHYNPAENQHDQLISPVIDINNSGPLLMMQLQFAYRPVGPIPFLHDTFRIRASSDCGQTFPYLLHEAWGDDLNSTGNYGSNFLPSNSNDWAPLIINLLSLIQSDPSMQWVFSFETSNRKGNPLYIDEIEIYEGFGLEEYSSRFQVFPNPSLGQFMLQHKNGRSLETTWHLSDLQGRPLLSDSFTGNQSKIDLSSFASGVYFLIVESDGHKEVLRLIKEG